MPTNTFLAHLVRRDWLTGGPLNELIVPYIEVLQRRRYARNTLSGYLRCLAHFSYWMRGEELTAADINRALIERFLQHHLPTCSCPALCLLYRTLIRKPQGASSQTAPFRIY